MSRSRACTAAAVVATATMLAPGGAGARLLEVRDDLGAPLPGLEVCFWFKTVPRCRDAAAGEPIPWPRGATALRVEGPGHGPVWVEAEDLPDAGPVIVPRKAELVVEGLPAGAALELYSIADPVFRVPLEVVRPPAGETPVLVPSGPMVLAVLSEQHAPDLHRLDAPPGGGAAIRFTARAGWSAVIRVTSAVRRRPLPGAEVRLIATSPTAPAANGELAASRRTDADGLVLLSGLEVPMATAEAVHPAHAPQTVRGLIAPAGGLHLQEVALRPGGALETRILWHGEPGANLRCRLFEYPVDPFQSVAPTRVARRGRTDEEGRWRAGRLPEGLYLLRVTAPGGAAHVDVPLRVTDRRVTERELDLRPRAIVGDVLRDGSPAVGFRVQVRTVWPATGPRGEPSHVVSPTIQGEAVTGADGGYRLTVLTEGPFDVELSAPDGTTIGTRHGQVATEGAEVSFSLAARSLRGRTRVERGGSIDADVSITWRGSRSPLRLQRGRAGPDGSFRFPVLAEVSGTARVVATKDGYLPAEAEVDFDPPDGAPEVELVLAPLRMLRGRVESGRGEPVAGAWVMSCPDRPEYQHWCFGEATTGPDGAFEVPWDVRLIPMMRRPESIRLWVSGPGCPLIDRPVDVSGGDGTGTRRARASSARPCSPRNGPPTSPPAPTRASDAGERSAPLLDGRAPSAHDRLPHPLGGVGAGAAGFGADAAVLHRLGVAVALLGAGPAGDGAGLELGAQGRRVLHPRPGHEAPRERADLCAVQVQADAAPQRGRVVLLQAGVGAGGAHRGARGGGLDEGVGLLARVARGVRVGGEDLVHAVHGAPS